jgi:hypothetical protein
MIHLADFHENYNHSMALRRKNTEFHTNQSRKGENASKN